MKQTLAGLPFVDREEMLVTSVLQDWDDQGVIALLVRESMRWWEKVQASHDNPIGKSLDEPPDFKIAGQGSRLDQCSTLTTRHSPVEYVSNSLVGMNTRDGYVCSWLGHPLLANLFLLLVSFGAQIAFRLKASSRPSENVVAYAMDHIQVAEE